MLLSHEKEFYFIHVPKTAGMSMRKLLLPWCSQNRLWWKLYEPVAHQIFVTFLGSGIDNIPFMKHVTAEVQLKKSPYLKNYFGFAFVRNPWDREVSLYHYIVAGEGSHHRRRFIRSLENFDAYIHWRYKNGERHRSQTKWTHDSSGKQLVDYIGRYENLHEDFDKICTIIDIQTPPLGRENPTKHKDYRSYYTDQTAEYVAKLYGDDCRTFGYSFHPN